MSDRPVSEYDVAVVGGGPGGSTLAALLARRGVSVALIERDAFPRDKLCGEFLSYDALPVVERLGVDLDGTPAIERCRIVSRSRTYEFALPHAARGVSRLRLDEQLFRTAGAAGATLLERSAVERISRGRLLVGGRDFVARVVVGAWGRWGRFDAQLGRDFVRDRVHRNFGFKRHYVRTRTTDPGVRAIELHSFDRGYLGVNDIEGGLTNICGLVHASRLTGHKGRWESFVDTLRQEEPGLDALYAGVVPDQDGFLSSEPVVFRPRAAVEQGVFMIGDASGILDPLTGNGMAMAIESALLLAPLVVRLLARPDERRAIESEYVARHREEFAPRIRWSRAISRLLSRPVLLDLAMRAGRSPRWGAFMVRQTRAQRESVERAAGEWFRGG